MTDQEILQMIWSRVQAIENKLDRHCSEEMHDFRDIRSNIAEIREVQARSGVKFSLAQGAITITLAAVAGAFFSQII